jgi:hypothetical protein
LKDFAHGKNEVKKLLLKPFLEKSAYLTKDNIVQIDNSHYQVPSSSSSNLIYDIDLDFGSCTCEVGYLGKLCKHRAGVYSIFLGLKTATLDDRYTIAVLALGDKANTKEFYKPLQKICEQSSTSVCSELLHSELPQTTLISLEQPSTSTFIHPIQNVDDSKSRDEKISRIVQKLSEFSCDYDLDKFDEKISKIKNPSEMSAFLNSFPTRKHYRTPINVQPTAVARRRPGVTRGNKRLASGRPSLSAVPKKKKRKHDLALNVSLNQANAR